MATVQANRIRAVHRESGGPRTRSSQRLQDEASRVYDEPWLVRVSREASGSHDRLETGRSLGR